MITPLTFDELSSLRVAGISYSTQNIGDDIQSLAAGQFFEHIDRYIDRERLGIDTLSQPHLMIINGWYCKMPEQTFPPAEGLIPVITGFHIDDRVKERFFSPENIAYFKRHAPIGCRDRQTLQWMQEHGIDAFFSGCLTLTFSKRATPPQDPKVILVDLPPAIMKVIPGRLLQGAIRKSHRVAEDIEDRFRVASDLLAFYRDHAGLVITKRLHCALPCLAMGIPVILFNDPDSYRMSVARDCGLPIHRAHITPFISRLRRKIKIRFMKRILSHFEHLSSWIWYRILNRQVWNVPKLPDISARQQTLMQSVRESLVARITQHTSS